MHANVRQAASCQAGRQAGRLPVLDAHQSKVMIQQPDRPSSNARGLGLQKQGGFGVAVRLRGCASKNGRNWTWFENTSNIIMTEKLLLRPASKNNSQEAGQKPSTDRLKVG